ncbi:MAG TPA: hypothetical protein VGX78_14700 [Pirellulales bacterium]|nr:hypothetical protein [Pirellulales bacterium]
MELPAELLPLVEKRAPADRRVKHRRGGPPRRSLAGAASKAGTDGQARPSERRVKQRRTTSTRRLRARRRG